MAPYISKAIHLDALPWGALSFYRQPWRGYLETVSGDQFISGVGINYNLPDTANHAVVIKLLADSGFRSLRLEIGWNTVDWTETSLVTGPRLQSIFSACKQHGLTPLILLNANQGGPCPSLGYNRVVVAGGELGSRRVQLNDVKDLVPGYSGISNLTDYWMAEVIFTSVDEATKTVQLSRPLRKALPAGTAVRLDTLKYLPLYPTGTPEFDQTINGWLKYVRLVMDALHASGITDSEIEIWNEFSFGSQFLSINNYYDPPAAPSPQKDWFFPGGQCWELARRTVSMLKATDPTTRVIWGFSNTSFFHTPVVDLPAGTDAQSYHPYGTSKRLIPKDFPPKERYPLFIEHFIPRSLSWCMPEGWAHLGVTMEYLLRLLNPYSRLIDRPKQTTVFSHYMTEHGFDAGEAGITNRSQALTYRAKAVIRALVFWLNKGVTRMNVFGAYDPADGGMGMLFAQPSPKDYAAYAEQQLMSPALQAIKNVIGQFAGAQHLGQVRQLSVEVTSIGAQPKVFDGDATHPPLYYREMFTFLPFQVNPRKFICAVYVMSYDITNPPPPMTFRLRVRNVNGTSARVSLYDPILNKPSPVQITDRNSSQITVRFQAVEYPRLLVINE